MISSNPIHSTEELINRDQSQTTTLTTLEHFKSHRELYTNFTSLFRRQDSLSGDSVDRLKKQIDTSQKKLEVIRQVQKPGYEGESLKLIEIIEHDQGEVERLLKRRTHIRFCLWEEMVFAFRSSCLLSDYLRELNDTERGFSERQCSNWTNLRDGLQRGLD